jgi:hypothetical protein
VKSLEEEQSAFYELYPKLKIEPYSPWFVERWSSYVKSSLGSSWIMNSLTSKPVEVEI